jgi:hypothetical protein
VEIPDALDVQPEAKATLTLYHAAAGGEAAPKLTFKLDNDQGDRVGTEAVRVYRFPAARNGETLTYTPGDRLYAELPLRNQQKFRWDLPTSAFQFAALFRAPALPGGDKAADKVKLMVIPETGVPHVPDLLPEADLDRGG